MSLATKYRPQTFESVCGQESIIKILERQIELNKFKNCYLFAGASGNGKTTLARIFANQINKGCGNPIEIDAASNSGVDNVRNIVGHASERSLDSEYKVIIIDECHSLSNSAWQAFLKCIEEPPKYTIFIFCTTDPQKIPETILNRVMRFNITRLSSDIIKERLKEICELEFIDYEMEALEYISKICHGSMRDGISLLEKVIDYNGSVYTVDALEALGDFAYDVFLNLTDVLLNGDEESTLKILNKLYLSGKDIKLFVEQYIGFILDIEKYILFNDFELISIPKSLEERLKFLINFENPNTYYNYVLDNLMQLKNDLKYDTSIKTTIEVKMLKICRCQ